MSHKRRSTILKKLRQLIYIKKQLATVDLSLVNSIQGKEPYELTIEQFKACFFKAALENTRLGKDGKPIDLLTSTWRKEVSDAIIALKPGVHIDSLESLRFTRLSKQVRLYAKHFKIELS